MSLYSTVSLLFQVYPGIDTTAHHYVLEQYVGGWDGKERRACVSDIGKGISTANGRLNLVLDNGVMDIPRLEGSFY